MIKNLLLFAAVAFISNSAFAQNYIWADTLQFENDFGITAILSDEDQNVYVASSQSTFATYLVSLFYCGDIHLRKYDHAGNLLWEKIFEGHARIFDFALDTDGNLIAGGGYVDSLNIDGDSYTTPLFVTGRFLMKLDPAGNVIWDIADEPAVFSNIIYSITTDNENNIYATGLATDIEALFAKYDTDGNELEIKNMGSVRTGSDVKVDNEGNIYLAGSCPDYASFDGINIPDEGTGTGYTNYLTKYDTEMNAQEVFATAYFTFDFNSSLAETSDGIYWRCTESVPFGFDQFNKTVFYDFASGAIDTIRRVDESFGIYNQYLQAPDDSTVYLLENTLTQNRILRMNGEGEFIDSFVTSNFICEFETFFADEHNIWIGGYVFDSLALDTITVYAEDGDLYQPFITRYGSDSTETDTTVTDSCNAFFEYTIDETGLVYFTNLSTGSDSSAIVSYQWNFCDGGISTSWDAMHVYLDTNVICACLTITDTLGCTDTYCVSDVIEGINNELPHYSVYPNPVTGNSFTITSQEEMYVDGIYDLAGKAISFELIQTGQNSFDIKLFTPGAGIYFLKLDIAGEIVMHKIAIL